MKSPNSSECRRGRSKRVSIARRRSFVKKPAKPATKSPNATILIVVSLTQLKAVSGMNSRRLLVRVLLSTSVVMLAVLPYIAGAVAGRAGGQASTGRAVSHGGCGCSELTAALSAFPMFARLVDAKTVGVKVPGSPVAVPLGGMMECPGPYSARTTQDKYQWVQGSDCDGAAGNQNNYWYTRHKCLWRYQGLVYVACSQWEPQGCSSEPPWNPLCADTNERLCSDTQGHCQTQ